MERGVKLGLSDYAGTNVVSLAKGFIGKVLVTRFNGCRTEGIITETEAYAGVTDRASHAFGGRRTERTEIMYRHGGTAYVYLCYGIHSLFNIVTNEKGVPHAVLVRSIYPLKGIDLIRKRRKDTTTPLEKLCVGPGKVAQALGIHFRDSGKKLTGKEIWLEDRGIQIPGGKLISGPRIGVDYAGDHAAWPYRFRIEHSALKEIFPLLPGEEN